MALYSGGRRRNPKAGLGHWKLLLRVFIPPVLLYFVLLKDTTPMLQGLSMYSYQCENLCRMAILSETE
jgi:hypothetical protein